MKLAIRDGILRLIDVSNLDRESDEVAADAIAFLDSFIARLAGDKGGGNPYLAGRVRWIVLLQSEVDAVFGLHEHVLPQLKRASANLIRAEIRAVYDEADAASRPAPNIKQLGDLVKLRLKEKGIEASAQEVRKFGDEAEFKARRRPVGKRIH